MQFLCWLLFLTGIYPLIRAFCANRKTSLIHAVGWGALAWLGWGLALVVAAGWPEMTAAARYVELCLIGCAGAAVLGARRPGVVAWNFVVAGLLAVLLLSLAEGVLIGGGVQLSPPRAVFLAGTLAIATLNYLPTRFALSACLLAAGSALELWPLLTDPATLPGRGTSAADLLLGFVPWTALWTVGKWPACSEPDRLWIDFRDRFGVIWGQRLREQFNRSAAHAGLRCELGWRGLHFSDKADPSDTAILAILRSLMKRFGEEPQPLERVKTAS